MSNLNWPESATHYGAETKEFNPGFYKYVEGKWLFMSEYGAPNGAWYHVGPGDDAARYVERPSEQPKPWSGPEDGLPPIGIECEYKGITVRVVTHSGNNGGDPLAVTQIGERGQIIMATASYFRAIKTPEKIAAEKRETAIRELMDIAQVDCRVTAARLVDAGFKLPSKSGEDREQGISDLRDHIAHANFRRSPNSGDEELAKQLYGAGFRRERTPDNPFR